MKKAIGYTLLAILGIAFIGALVFLAGWQIVTVVLAFVGVLYLACYLIADGE